MEGGGDGGKDVTAGLSGWSRITQGAKPSRNRWLSGCTKKRIGKMSLVFTVEAQNAELLPEVSPY